MNYGHPRDWQDDRQGQGEEFLYHSIQVRVVRSKIEMEGIAFLGLNIFFPMNVIRRCGHKNGLNILQG